jgi:hypothetical protein
MKMPGDLCTVPFDGHFATSSLASLPVLLALLPINILFSCHFCSLRFWFYLFLHFFWCFFGFSPFLLRHPQSRFCSYVWHVCHALLWRLWAQETTQHCVFQHAVVGSCGHGCILAIGVGHAAAGELLCGHQADAPEFCAGCCSSQAWAAC